MIADAWGSISTQTIINCWAKADITGDGIQTRQQVQQGKDKFETFISLQRAHCQHSMAQVMPPEDGNMANYHSAFEEFFFFDEDEVDEMINESDLPDVFTLVQAGITAGVLNRSPTELDLSEADAV